MKRSTIIICIMYFLFVGLNISLSVVLVNQIKAHNEIAATHSLEQRSMMVHGNVTSVDAFYLKNIQDSKTSVTSFFSNLKSSIWTETKRIITSRNHQEEVKNYIPFNPVYNFLQ